MSENWSLRGGIGIGGDEGCSAMRCNAEKREKKEVLGGVRIELVVVVVLVVAAAMVVVVLAGDSKKSGGRELKRVTRKGRGGSEDESEIWVRRNQRPSLL